MAGPRSASGPSGPSSAPSSAPRAPAGGTAAQLSGWGCLVPSGISGFHRENKKTSTLTSVARLPPLLPEGHMGSAPFPSISPRGSSEGPKQKKGTDLWQRLQGHRYSDFGDTQTRRHAFLTQGAIPPAVPPNTHFSPVVPPRQGSASAAWLKALSFLSR